MANGECSQMRMTFQLRSPYNPSLYGLPVLCPCSLPSLLFLLASAYINCKQRDDEGAVVGCQSGLRPRDTPLRHTQDYHPLCLAIPVNLP